MPAMLTKEIETQRERHRLLVFGLVVFLVGICADLNGFKWALLFDEEGVESVQSLLSGFASPDFSASFLKRIFILSIESLAIGVVGTTLAASIGIFLTFFATRFPGLPSRAGHRGVLNFLVRQTRVPARILLVTLRSIPDIIWAFLFVRLIGLGAGAAVLALGMNVGGVFGKLYSELGEAVDPQPVRDLERMGVGRVGIFLYGILPQVKRQWTAYALFRLECSVRSASILGIVGAGGLGSEIALSIRYFQFDKLATTLLVVFVYIFLLEILAAKLRKSEAKFTLSLAGIGTAAGLVYLDIPWGELFENGNDFMVSLSSWPGPEQLLNAVGLTLQTVSMAWAATGLAAIVAFVLAPIATINFGAKTNIGSGRGQVFHTWGYWALYGISRGLLLFFRAIPELTMALIFVFWVGPGAFAGLLAIALHTVGVLGRLYCDTYEDIAPDPVAALEKLGTKPFGLWLYGIWPQAAGRILAYTLYRFEVKIRVSATMGFVGAGGIGFALHKAISLFHTADLILLLAVMVGVVVIFDFVGDHLRRKILMPANHEDRRPRVLVGGLREEPVLN